MPQGILIALYVFPLGLMASAAFPWLTDPKRRNRVVPVAAVVLLACWAFELGTEVEVATLIVPTAWKPLWVIATDLSDLSFLMLAVIYSPALARIPGLIALGRNSLLVYLIHPLLYKLIPASVLAYVTKNALSSVTGFAIYCGGAVLSVAAVTSVSLALAITLQAWPRFTTLVTPRTLREWSSNFVFGRVRREPN